MMAARNHRPVALAPPRTLMPGGGSRGDDVGPALRFARCAAGGDVARFAARSGENLASDTTRSLLRRTARHRTASRRSS